MLSANYSPGYSGDIGIRLTAYKGLASGRKLGDEFLFKMRQTYGTEENTERYRRAGELGKKKGGYTASQIAIAWVLNRNYPICAVCGAHTIEGLRSCFAATAVEITQSEAAWLELKISHLD